MTKRFALMALTVLAAWFGSQSTEAVAQGYWHSSNFHYNMPAQPAYSSPQMYGGYGTGYRGYGGYGGGLVQTGTVRYLVPVMYRVPIYIRPARPACPAPAVQPACDNCANAPISGTVGQ